MSFVKGIGRGGEDKAARYLLEHGYGIVARNWHARNGELDIVAHKDATLVIAEVKTFPHGDAVTVERALGRLKRDRIIETAKRFLLSNRQYSDDYIRFDVIVVDTPGFPDIYHIEDAFTE